MADGESGFNAGRQRRKKSNDEKIARSWGTVNQNMKGESDFQKEQRQAEEKVKESTRLRQQADNVLRRGNNGK